MFGSAGNSRTVSITRKPGLRRATVTVRLTDGTHEFQTQVRLAVGTAGADRIRGSAGPDLLFGLGGDDRIAGRGGNDLICGGAGNDRLAGGAGDDVVIGGRGDDERRRRRRRTTSLRGDTGADRLVGGAGDDELRGGPRGDVVLRRGQRQAGRLQRTPRRRAVKRAIGGAGADGRRGGAPPSPPRSRRRPTPSRTCCSVPDTPEGTAALARTERTDGRTLRVVLARRGGGRGRSAAAERGRRPARRHAHGRDGGGRDRPHGRSRLAGRQGRARPRAHARAGAVHRPAEGRVAGAAARHRRPAASATSRRTPTSSTRAGTPSTGSPVSSAPTAVRAVSACTAADKLSRRARARRGLFAVTAVGGRPRRIDGARRVTVGAQRTEYLQALARRGRGPGRRPAAWSRSSPRRRRS